MDTEVQSAENSIYSQMCKSMHMENYLVQKETLSLNRNVLDNVLETITNAPLI